VLTPIALSQDHPSDPDESADAHGADVVRCAPQAPRKYAVVEIPHKVFSRMLFLPSEKGHPLCFWKIWLPIMPRSCSGV